MDRLDSFVYDELPTPTSGGFQLKGSAMRLHDLGFLLIAAGICAAIALVVAAQVA